jgi:hypothetical protein
LRGAEDVSTGLFEAQPAFTRQAKAVTATVQGRVIALDFRVDELAAEVNAITWLMRKDGRACLAATILIVA